MKLSYLIFDFDDNILHMNTKLHMEKFTNESWHKIKMSTEEFVNFKNHPNYRPINDNWNSSFLEFSDKGERGDKAFINDIKQALNKKQYGPSFNDFIECLIKGKIFAIITARGHKSSTIRKGVEFIIDTVLSDHQIKLMKDNIKKFRKHFRTNKTDNLIKSYLDNCEYIGVTSPKFEILLNKNNINIIDTPSAKILAFKMFVKKVRSYSNNNIQIGFSDDDHKNVKGIKDFVDTLETEYPNIDFSIFHTYDGIKKEII